MNRKKLHEIEMELCNMLEEGTLTREHIINHFTDIMNEKDNISECEHEFEYADKNNNIPYFDDDGYHYIDMFCVHCGKKNREKYTFEGLEE